MYYLLIFIAFASATRNLYSQLSSLYPNNGPLYTTLNMLSESFLQENSLKTTLDMYKGLIIVPMDGIYQLTNTIIENINLRDRIAAEREHYISKVGKLMHDSSSSQKNKLKDNQTKLSVIMNEHSSLVNRVTEASGVLESDMIAILTPTLSQYIKMQKSHYENEIYILQTGINDYQSKPLPNYKTITNTKNKTKQESVGQESNIDNRTSINKPFVLPSRSSDDTSSSHSEANVHAKPGSMIKSSSVPLNINPASIEPQKLVTNKDGTSLPTNLPFIPSIPTSPMHIPKSTPTISSIPTGVESQQSAKRTNTLPFIRNNVPDDYDIVQAIANYKATADGDISFNEQDIFLILHKDKSGWWDSRFQSEYGICPSNYIRSLSTTTTNHHQQQYALPVYGIAKVLYDHIPEDNSELPIHINDTIVLFEKLSPSINTTVQWILGGIINTKEEEELRSNSGNQRTITIDKAYIGYVPYNYLSIQSFSPATSTSKLTNESIPSTSTTTTRQPIRILSSTNIPTSETSQSTPVLENPYKSSPEIKSNILTNTSTTIGKTNFPIGITTSSSTTQQRNPSIIPPPTHSTDRKSMLSGIESFQKSSLKKTPTNQNSTPSRSSDAIPRGLSLMEEMKLQQNKRK